MASSIFTSKSFQGGTAFGDNNNNNAEEKKNNDGTMTPPPPRDDISADHPVPSTPDDGGGGGANDDNVGLSSSESIPTFGGISTPHLSESSAEDDHRQETISMSDGRSDDPPVNDSANSSGRSRDDDDGPDATVADDNDTGDDPSPINDDNNNHDRIKWSSSLSTPADSSPLFTPTSDPTSLKSNLHGLGLKHAADRSKVLSRTGRGCASLLDGIAGVHDELASSLGKLLRGTGGGSGGGGGGGGGGHLPPHSNGAGGALEMAAAGTPMEGFAADVAACLASYADRTRAYGSSAGDDVAGPYRENSSKYLEEVSDRYVGYTACRGRCVVARKEALRSRRRYLDACKDLDGAIGNLRNARASKVNGGRTKRKVASSSDSSSTKEMLDRSGHSEGVEVYNPSASSWEEELRDFGERNGLARQCEAVIKCSEDARRMREKYVEGVEAENVAVDDAQDAEREALGAVQRLEEERIIVLIGLLDRFLKDQKGSLENMSLDLTAVEPLDLEEHKELSPSVAATATMVSSPSPLFMTPRRNRAQSDDGPAINETRMLNLPDNIAEIRDATKSLMGRSLSRLKTLKFLVAFNEGLASAIENFASGLKSQVESTSPSTHTLNKTEGGNVLHAWNATMGSLEMHAKYAELLAKQIRRGNSELQSILGPAERDAKTFWEREEFRWRNLCDAARVETKAKMKHKQCVADLEKARVRVDALVEGEGGGSPSDGGGGAGGDGDNAGSVSPMKPSTKMDRHMNKAMGKMFSILPGGGEDVMNKVLTPQQRQAIATRQFDEAKTKEEKGTESFEVACSVKQQAVVAYETEAEATAFKFKTDDRHEWDAIQNSLACAVMAVRNFRDGQLKAVMSSIDMIEGNLRGKAQEDVARWTAYTWKRVNDQRDRGVDNDVKEEENGQSLLSGECGFSLKVQLEEGATDVQVLIRRFLDDEDVVMDEVDIAGLEDDNDSSSASDAVTGGDKVNNEISASKTTKPPQTLPDVPPDTIVEKMDPIFSKTLNNVSIDDYYSAGWSEEIPLYGPWLERKGSFDVSVGEWEHSDAKSENGGGFENAWSGEIFSQKRIIKFKFKRTTHLYIGPPVAGVTQTQYLVKDGNDRCVVMMTVEMDGIPYSDTFAVEVRWAARRLKESDIAVDAGVHVRFTKSSMFASKIKSGTLKETSPIHLDLFEVIKSAIAFSEDDEDNKELEVDEPDEETINVVPTETHAPEISITKSPSQIEGIFSQFVATVLSLPQNQQLLLAFVILVLVTKMLFFRRMDYRTEEIDELAQKVDDLTNEVREMKDMIRLILKLSNENIINQREEL